MSTGGSCFMGNINILVLRYANIPMKEQVSFILLSRTFSSRLSHTLPVDKRDIRVHQKKLNLCNPIESNERVRNSIWYFANLIYSKLLLLFFVAKQATGRAVKNSKKVKPQTGLLDKWGRKVRLGRVAEETQQIAVTGETVQESSLNSFYCSVFVRTVAKIYSPTPFDAAKALKLEEDFTGGCMSMYSTPDKMKMSTPGCFPGRYSPTSYRGGPDQMRRCMTNPSVSGHVLATILIKLYG